MANGSGQSAQDRGADEDRHAEDEHLLAAEDIAESAEGEKQHGVGKDVAVEDPLNLGQ